MHAAGSQIASSPLSCCSNWFG